MKNIFKTLAIVALGIFATSCVSPSSQDAFVAGETVKVSFTASGALSRAVGEAENVDILYVNVYSADGSVYYPNASKVVSPYDPAGQAVELELVTGMSYQISFWAQKEGVHSVDGATKTVTIADFTGNDDDRDAFYAVEPITVSGPDSKDIFLYRPFSQLNFGASDFTNAVNAGFSLTGLALTTKTYTEFNLLTGEVGGLQDVTFSATTRMAGNVPTASGTYDWLTMNYILVGEDVTFNAELTITNANGTAITVSQPSVPFRRNWRTNVLGKLLTDTQGFVVEVIPGFDGELLP